MSRIQYKIHEYLKDKNKCPQPKIKSRRQKKTYTRYRYFSDLMLKYMIDVIQK